MSDLESKLAGIDWAYANQDIASIEELEARIADTGKKFGLISYSDLVRGIEFNFPNINDGGPYHITTFDWSGLDRAILGDCLGFISMRSYLEAGFMASALVVARTESKPSDVFFEWMNALELIPNLSEASVLKFWVEEVKKAHNWYKYGKKI